MDSALADGELSVEQFAYELLGCGLLTIFLAFSAHLYPDPNIYYSSGGPRFDIIKDCVDALLATSLEFGARTRTHFVSMPVFSIIDFIRNNMFIILLCKLHPPILAYMLASPKRNILFDCQASPAAVALAMINAPSG